MGQLAENALLDRDMARLNQDLQVLTGKAIVMAVPETVLSKSLGHLVSDVGIDIATAAAQAAGHLAEGRRFEAARIIGGQIADQFAITIAGRITVAAMQHQIDSVLNSLIYRLKTRVRYQDIPRSEDYAAKSTVYYWLRRWSEEGVLEGIWQRLLSLLETEGELDMTEGSLDGSFVPSKRGAKG